MEYILELPPVSRKFIDKIAPLAKNVFNAVFIPSGPAGIPLLDACATSIYISTVYGLKSIFSIRLKDVNLNHVIEKVKTAMEFGINGVLLTKGDPPRYGSSYDDLSSEYVLKYLREINVDMKLGLIISLRYPLGSILKRISEKPDFVFIIHHVDNDLDKLMELRKHIAGEIKIYDFILLGVDKNIELFKELGQKYVEPMKLGDHIEKLNNIVDGVIISSPLEVKKAIEIVSKLVEK
ncbi:MAG: hypothetical protein QXP02_03725 [Desulfurococcaceae archaeon]